MEATMQENNAVLVPVSPTPLDLLRQAISQGVSIEQLERLQAMHERWEANEARKAFVVAMNDFKANPPEITKNKDVAFGNTKYSHATLDHVCDAVTKGLSAHGISHRWKVEQDKEWITVTCILTHALGHSEETMLRGAADNSGSKNPIQAIGSTVTYLQRYTLLAATGLAAQGADTDGRNGNGNGKADTLPEDRVVMRLDEIAAANDDDELKRFYLVALREAQAINDRAAQDAYGKAKNKKYRELHAGGGR